LAILEETTCTCGSRLLSSVSVLRTSGVVLDNIQCGFSSSYSMIGKDSNSGEK
jgi:hypothetical protein